MKSLYSILFTLFLFLNPCLLIAQSTFHDFILTAFEDLNTAKYDAQLDFLKPHNYSIPIIDEIEIRGGNDEFNREDQQYAIRLRPSNPWKIRRNNALFNATRKELDIRKKLVFAENLKDRYTLALAYIFEQKSLEIRQENFQLLQQRITVLEENQQTNLFDGKDYIEAKLELIEALVELNDSKSDLNNLEIEILSILQTASIDWSDLQLISTEKASLYSQQVTKSMFNSTELELIAQELEVAKRELSLEKADFDLGFVQGEYNPFRDNDSDLGLSAGITIPVFKRNKHQIAERKLDEIQLRNELISEQQRDSVNRILNYNYLQQLILHHTELVNQIKLLNLDSLVDQLNKIEDNNPLSLLDIQEGILKVKELELQSEEQLLKQYLEFLEAFDVYSQSSLINLISTSMEHIK